MGAGPLHTSFQYAINDRKKAPYPMCTRAVEKDGNVFACRTCNECIAVRRHGWISRAMAEKATNEHAICLTLTYSEETQESRDGARFFCYADVQAFMKRLRAAARYEAEKGGWNFVPQIRFLCAGEQGDRYGRCHWHLIVYSNFDLSRIGQFRRRGHLVSHRRDLITVGKRKRRLNWTLWPHGFVTVQEPDEAGMAYVLSYCLKDQFTAEKSQGTMREAKAENFATGLFRMSKRPAIGEEWLMRKMEELDASGSVLPSLQIKIPDMSGYWHPNGSFREKLLWCLVALNQRVVWSTGAPAPQWAALLASCKDNPSDMEILLGPEKEEDPVSLESEFVARSRQIGGDHARREFVRKCGAELPCEDCLHNLSGGVLRSLGVQRGENEHGEWVYQALEGFDPVAARQRRSGGGINPFCAERGSKAARLAFPASGPHSPRGPINL